MSQLALNWEKDNNKSNTKRNMVASALKKTSQSVEDVIPATFALLVLAAEK